MAVPRLSGFALITGGGSGIGRETGFVFAEAGSAGVAFADVNLESAQAAAEESKKYATNDSYRPIAIHVDVAQRSSVEEMARAVVKEFGRIDYLINSAGIGNTQGAVQPVASIDLEHLEQAIDINLRGTIYSMAAVAKIMLTQEPLTYTPTTPRSQRNPARSLGRGSIVNLASINSLYVQYGTLSYSASKHGVIAATKAAATDHAREGIRVNAVCPGLVDTPMTERMIQREPKLSHLIKAFVPIEGRMAFAEEIAEYIAFLCSPGASYITGDIAVIDGGVSIGPPRL